MELVKFDMQKINNPNIKGKEYQQGTLLGFETREYLLEKWERKCAYCATENVPLQAEHIMSRARGGTDSITNLTLSCEICNQKKGTQHISTFLKGKPELLKKILTQSKTPLKDAAAMNATRWDLFRTLKQTGLPIECGSGGLTKYNRTKRNLSKSHWIDAACVGKSTPNNLSIEQVFPLYIKATGHGSRQVCNMNKYGFPRTSAKGQKVVNGFQTGDMIKAVVTKGKKVGVYLGRVAVRTSGSFNIRTKKDTIQSIGWKCCTILQRVDGYMYST